MTALALVSSNKIGQQLGPRGFQTRARLLAAAESLLRTTSPIDLSAAEIARAAGTSAATFYVYFDDVRDLVLSLTPGAAPALEAMFPRNDSLLLPTRRHEDAATMIAAVFDAWDRSAAILLFRNLEADRGDAAFDGARTAWAAPVIERLIRAMDSASRTPRTDADAYADAVVLLAALERIAAASHRAPTFGPPVADLRASLQRMICQALA